MLLPNKYRYINFSKLETYDDYKLYSFDAYDKGKFINYKLQAYIIKKPKQESEDLKIYLNLMDYAPDDFKLPKDKYYDISKLLKKKTKNYCLIHYEVNKTCKEYLKEIKQFNKTNRYNSNNYKKNVERVKKNITREINKLYQNGYCLKKIDLKSIKGNHDMSSVYFVDLSLIKICDKSNKRKIIEKLDSIFSTYIL